MFLEFHQAGDQRAPFAFGHAEAEQHENGIRLSLLNHDAATGEEGRHQRRGDATVLHLTVEPLARRQHRDLDRVQHAVVGAQVTEAMPAGLR
ncbi:hypothetical protein D3C86_1405130 [compost metagenome]